MARIGLLLLGAVILAVSPLIPARDGGRAWAIRPCADIVQVHINATGVMFVDGVEKPRGQVVKAVAAAAKAAACHGDPIVISAEPETLYGDLIWLMDALEAAGFRNIDILDISSDQEI